jgi:Cupin
MDPLSDVLSLLKPRTYMAGGFDMGGEWSIRFGAHEGIKCYAVVSGQCWLCVEGVPDAVRLETGDCFLLPRGWPFRLTSDLALTPVDAHTMFPLPLNGGIASCNGGGDCFGVGGYFAFTGQHAGILLGVLPPIVHIRKEADKAAMRWSLERMRQELHERQPGGFLVAQQLAYMILVQALRLHLAEGLNGGVGWLFALADKQMSAAITSMHDDPAYRWTLPGLAERAGMPRSIFALKFKETVGARLTGAVGGASEHPTSVDSAEISPRSSLQPAVYIGSNIQRRHLSPCACAMGASVPEMQLMVDALFVKEAAEVAVVVEERVGLADG